MKKKQYFCALIIGYNHLMRNKNNAKQVIRTTQNK